MTFFPRSPGDGRHGMTRMPTSLTLIETVAVQRVEVLLSASGMRSRYTRQGAVGRGAWGATWKRTRRSRLPV